MNQKYEDFNQKKQALSKMMNELSFNLKKLGATSESQNLSESRRKLEAENFRVMVMGNFNAGKSTFINALLGDDILPTDILPCTAVVNEIYYSKSKKAVVHFKNPLPNKFANLSSKIVRKYISENNSEIPPLEIDVEDLAEFVTIDNPEDVIDDIEVETPIEKVEIYWPTEICKNGVIITDSPGLEDHSSRTKVVYDYFHNADIVIFLMNAYPDPAKETELGVIDRVILGGGHDFIFYVANRIDTIPSRHKDRLFSFIKSRLRNRTKLGEHGIYFISALNALDGKLENDEALVEQSGFPLVEESLSSFLTENKGRMRLARIAKDCSSVIIPIVEDRIPFRKRLLLQDQSTLENKYLEKKPKLDLLEKEITRINSRLNDRIGQMRPSFQSLIENQLGSIALKIPRWKDELKISSSFSLFSPKKSSKRIVAEVLEKLQEKMNEDQEYWMKHSFSNVVEVQIKDMMSEFEKDYEVFQVELQDIKTDIMSISSDSLEEDNIGIEERVGAATVGLLLGNIGAAFYGSAVGFEKSLMKQIGIQLGLTVALILAGITNPFIILGLIFSGGFIQFILKGDKQVEKIKDKVCDTVAEKMSEDREKNAKKSTDTVLAKVLEIVKPIKQSMQNDLDTLKEQVDLVIQEKKEGQIEVDKKISELLEIEKNIKKLDKRLEEFTFSLIGV